MQQFGNGLKTDLDRLDSEYLTTIHRKDNRRYRRSFKSTILDYIGFPSSTAATATAAKSLQSCPTL